MDSQERTSSAMGSQGKKTEDNRDDNYGAEGAHGAHAIAIEEQSLSDKGKGKLDESGKAEEEKDGNTTGVMDSQAGTSGVKGSDETRKSAILKTLRDKLGNVGKSDPTVFRVPSNIRRNNKSMFEPSVISIGPYHRDRPHLRAMEEKKGRFLEDFLSHIKGGGYTLERCVQEVDSLYDLAQSCYSETIHMDRGKFTEMMVLDGCFIVEFFYKVQNGEGLNEITAGWTTLIIEKDFILLENQIPFEIILALNGFLDESKRLNFENIAQLLTGNLIHNERSMASIKKSVHLLHLCHSYAVADPVDPIPSPTRCCYLNCIWAHFLHHIRADPAFTHFFNRIRDSHFSQFSNWIRAVAVPHFLNWIRAVPVLKNCLLERAEEDERTLKMTIPCATDLEVAGVKFKRGETSDELTKINFTSGCFRSGSLVIPPLHIENGMKPLLLNFVSLEQCLSLHLKSHFSTYIVFMDKLVNTPNDVKILQQKGILDNMLSSEQEVALFFNRAGKNVYIPQDHDLADLFKDVNRYCGQGYHKHRARLCRDYFSSPWTIFSLVAAIILLLLTIAQTFMAVLSYKQAWFTYKHPKQP